MKQRVTTHSLFLLRELDMMRTADKDLKKGDVRFFNLSGKGKVEQGDSPEELGDILLLDESVLQSQRYLDVQQQIKDKVHRICPHPLVIDATNQHHVPWTVR